MQRVRLTTAQLEALQQRLRALPDGRHPGSAGSGAIAEWAARLSQALLKRLRARYHPHTGASSAFGATIRRLLQTADAAFGDWLLGVAGADAVAVDGKVVCGAVRADGTQVPLLSAFLQGQGVTMAQREIPAKTNEIPQLKPLL